MAEALKDIYSKSFIFSLSDEFKRVYKPWKEQKFKELIFSATWKDLELKDRMRHISQSIHTMLSGEYDKDISILMKVAENKSGYEHMFFPDYVEVYGLEHWQTSLKALEHFTQFSSSEFAVRPFILKDSVKMMKQMLKWSKSRNYHIRRLASEGCRSRLPWAVALPEFKKDPSPILPILENLKKDPEEYVRKSVANNLNDISKDNPVTTLEFIRSNIGKNPHTDWILKHGARTLLKNSNPEALRLFGYHQPNKNILKTFSISPKVKMGDDLNFTLSLSSSARLGLTRLEYIIEFVRLNGKHSQKVFKISESHIDSKEKHVEKKHSFKPISTRKYYPGMHKLSIKVNGIIVGQKEFELV